MEVRDTPLVETSLKKKSRARMVIVLLTVAVLLAGVVFAGLMFVTRGSAARSLILGELSSMVDADLDLARVSIGLDGRIVLTDVTVRVPGVAGTAGEVISARTLRIETRGLLSGSPVVERLLIEEPVVRVSQSIDNGSLNLRELRFRQQDQTSGAALPAIEIVGGIIELGEHTDATYTSLRRIPIKGTFRPSDQADSYEFEVIHGLGGSEDSRLSGRIMPDDVEVLIDELDLASWPNEAVPTRYRELHRRLALAGRVEPTRVVVNRATGVEILVRLSEVELTLPLDELPVQNSRMTGVSGYIRLDPGGFEAKVSGLLDGVPTTALISGPDASLASAFECAISVGRVQLTENIGRLSYLPEYVREQLQIFSNPVAQVELDLVLNRASQPGSEIETSGEIRLFNGVASYREFPYEFVDLEGLFLLDADRLTIRYVRGRSTNGSKIEADGWVAPLGDDAEAIINVRATDVPLDAKLRAGLSERNRTLYDALLSREGYQRLIDDGRIVTGRQGRLWTSERNRLRAQLRRNEIAPGEIEAAAARADELDVLLQTPAFDVGGVGTVTVYIHRHFGVESLWDREIRIELPSVGFVPEHFPLPILAELVAIRIVDGEAELTSGVFKGVEGGVAHVTARAQLEGEERSSDVQVTARGVPLTAMLIDALPEAKQRNESALSVRELLGRLGLAGEVDCEASFSQREGSDELNSLLIEIVPRGVSASPAQVDPDSSVGLRLEEIEGIVKANNKVVEVHLGAQATSTGTSNGDGEASSVASRVEAHVVLGLEIEAGRPEIEQARVLLPSFELSLPIENLVGIVDVEAARRVATLRAVHAPAGRVDASVSRADAQSPIVLSMRDGVDVEVSVWDHRFGLVKTQGSLTLTRDERTTIATDRFGGLFAVDGEAVGLVTASGVFDAENGAGKAEIEVSEGRIESNGTALLVSRLMPEFAQTWREQQPAGVLDLRVEIESDDKVRASQIDIRPRAFEFGQAGHRVRVRESSGQIVLFGGKGRVEELRLLGEQWSSTLRGSFEVMEGSGFDADLRVDVQAAGLPPSLRSLVPDDFGSILEAISIDVAGPLLVRDTQLLVGKRPTGIEVNTVGEVIVENASASIGVNVTELDGRIAFSVHQHPSFDSTRFEMQIEADRLRASGIWLLGAVCTVKSSLDGEAVEVGPFSATAHDGRVVGSAVVWRDAGAKVPRFDLHALMSSVRLAPVLADLSLDTAEPDPTTAADESRGVIDAQLTLYGELGGARRGMGQVQISKGRVLRLPLLVPLIEVSNLQLPRGELLDIARAQFYVRDEALTLEELSVLSRSIELLGYGTLSLASQELDLRINSRAVRRIPLVSEVLDSVRDELVTVRIEGTVRSPKIRTEQFMTTRRAVLSVLGWEPNEQEKLLRDIKQRALRYRERARLSSEQISRVVDAYAQPDEPEKP